MRKALLAFALLAPVVVASACGEGDAIVSVPLAPDDASGGGDGASSLDAAAARDGFAADSSSQSDGSAVDSSTAPDASSTASNIKHVVIIVQENHTFDSYFGRYCTAAAGSNPSCNTGPSCCEAAPATEPSGKSPVVLDDAQNAGTDPNHTHDCEVAEMNGGAMDRYVTGASCSAASNFAIASAQAVKPYTDYAGQYALADRYFQPIIGQSTSNDMFFAVAKYVFTDNAFEPNTNGKGCDQPFTATKTYQNVTTMPDLLIRAGKSFAFYAEGYQRMLSTTIGCPSAPADCPAHIAFVPCNYAPSDNPFQFYAQFADNRTYQKDLDELATDLRGTLPSVSFVKAIQYHDEHPGYGTTISAGTTFVQKIVSDVMAAHASDTLILLTWDEGGGYFDHVHPPPDNTADSQPYGTRVPLIAIGRFAKKNFVSHVTMEHSSIVRFIELNFLGATGQLAGRDAVVQNIGSLLDPAETGIVIP